MANYPEMQTKMRKEIEKQIGDRISVQSDKQNCDYVNAFISETLRHRIVAPMSVPHKTICNVVVSKLINLIRLLLNIKYILGGYKIPKNTSVAIHTFGSCMIQMYFQIQIHLNQKDSLNQTEIMFDLVPMDSFHLEWEDVFVLERN